MSEEIFSEIDSLIEHVDKYKLEPEFTREVESRTNREVKVNLSNNKLMKIFIELIAFSQNANSASVRKVVDSKIFEEIFANYDIDAIAKMNPCDIADHYWDKISGIRQQSKLFHIVSLARKIKNIDSFEQLMTNTQIPHRIQTEEDINKFWNGFQKLKKTMNDNKVPFFRSTTSLLHFLLEAGYDCAKPDLVVMRVAKKLDIVKSEKGEKNLVKAIRTIQEYSITGKIRPSIIDLYFLIDEGQREAKKFVKDEFYKIDKKNNLVIQGEEL